jgi:hypothetical protein
VQLVISNQWQWLNFFSYVNVVGGYIPYFYIFKGKQMRMDFIAKYELKATMAMQSTVSISGFLFSAWIEQLMKSMESCGRIFQTN